MKKSRLFTVGVLVLTLVLVLALAGCDNGGGGPNNVIPYSTPKVPEKAKYVSFDEITGNMIELVIEEDVAARYTAKKGDTYILTIYDPDGNVLATSNGKVSSTSGNEIKLEHSSGAVITVAVSTSGDSSIITSLETDDDTIPVDTDSKVQAVQKPAKLNPGTPGLEFELIEEGNNAGTYSVSKYTGKGVVMIIPASYNDKPVTEIGVGAFDDCTHLTSVTIPSSVTSIRYTAFRNCTGLTSVTIPASVTFISQYAFWDCTSLTSVTIPSSVTEIGWGAFERCKSLTGVTISEGVTTIGSGMFGYCENLTSVAIPASVTEVGNWLFQHCTSLTNVTFAAGSQPKTISDGMFFMCPSLTSVTIPSGVTSINKQAFSRCTSLTSVTFATGSQLETIGDSAFNYCESLTSLTIPESVTSIENAFQGWTSSQTINVRGYASLQAACDAWGTDWLSGNNATLKFWNGSSYQ